MSVNGITGTQAAYAGYTSTQSTAASEKTSEASSSKDTSGVVYEPTSKTTGTAANSTKTYKQDTATIAKLKADAEERTSQLRSLVEQLMSKQGTAYGQANNMWSFLAGGNYTVDPATRAQAQADIAEDGYWGVTQTSDRILDFAKALTGGDPSKADEMLEAFKKGYEQAAKKWGGNLPDISQRTYDAVISKFEQWKSNETGTTN
ncbi:MAG: hypothetical protein HDR01_02960 [Lachnospiraceae bacterium]|nr:hypothetical protein [Lachnospiraceae bacterium]